MKVVAIVPLNGERPFDYDLEKNRPTGHVQPR